MTKKIDIDSKCVKLAARAFRECSDEKSRIALFEWIKMKYIWPAYIYSAGEFLN